MCLDILGRFNLSKSISLPLPLLQSGRFRFPLLSFHCRDTLGTNHGTPSVLPSSPHGSLSFTGLMFSMLCNPTGREQTKTSLGLLASQDSPYSVHLARSCMIVLPRPWAFDLTPFLNQSTKILLTFYPWHLVVPVHGPKLVDQGPRDSSRSRKSLEKLSSPRSQP